MSRFENRKKVEVKQEGTKVFFNSSEKPVKDIYVRHTFYLTAEQRMAISLMATYEYIDKSEVVRRALDAFIPKNYFEMVDKNK